jgi:hypothetical protein
MAPLREWPFDGGLRLPSSWPGADGGGRDLEVDPDKLLQAAALLESAVPGLTGSLDDLRARGSVTAQQAGNWDAGQTLAATTQRASAGISAVYDEFVNDYVAAIELLRTTAAHYRDAEDATTGQVREVSPGSAPTRSTAPPAD